MHQQPLWNWSGSTTVIVSAAIAVIIGCSQFVVRLRTDPELDPLRGTREFKRVSSSASTVLFGSVADAVLWLGARNAEGVLPQQTLSTVGLALGVLISATAASTWVLWVDMSAPNPSKRIRFRIAVYTQRSVAVFGAALTVMMVTDTRQDLNPGTPKWHLAIRVLYVLVPLLAVRMGDGIWRRRLKEHKPQTRTSSVYGSLRGLYLAPFIAVIVAAAAAVGYSFVLWSMYGTGDDKNLGGPAYGHLAVLGILGTLSTCLALLEMAPSADSMATMWDRTFGLRPTTPPPAHASARTYRLPGDASYRVPEIPVSLTYGNRRRPQHARRRGKVDRPGVRSDAQYRRVSEARERDED